jgi:uncharacterized protein (DUF2237 family)
MQRMTQSRRPLNVLGTPLEDCSHDPKTGWFRDGCCRTDDQDRGSHTVCAKLTAEFLEFSVRAGNDLVTPRPEFGFPGLNPGDSWCVCASRWMQAFEAGVAPPIRLEATHEKAMQIVPLAALRYHAIEDDAAD